MDCCQKFSVAGDFPSNCEKQEEISQFGFKIGTLDGIFSTHNSEGDADLEWLSTFMEDCLTSTGNCLPPQIPTNIQTNSNTTSACKIQNSTASLPRNVIPGKRRSKRKRRSSISNTKIPLFTSWSSQNLNRNDQTFLLKRSESDPPLLQQAYWLADSELVKPGIENTITNTTEKISTTTEQEQMIFYYEEAINPGRNSRPVTRTCNLAVAREGAHHLRYPLLSQEQTVEETIRGERLGCSEASNGQPRICAHCLSKRTPQWRAGPLGPKTLCNACGVRYKSGRLLPEYRPAKSPTFVSYKHSNSHKKVMEMRMALLSSNS